MIQQQQNKDDVIVIKEKKRGGCGTFIGGFFIGALSLILCIVGVGAFLFYRLSLSSIEAAIGIEVPFIRGEYETMPLRDLVKELFGKANDIKNYTIADLSEEKNLVDLPTKIPGTDLDLQGVYDYEITFNGRTDKVKNFAVYNEIYKDFDGFVDKIIEVVYKINTIDNLLSSLNIDLDTDLNYPAFKSDLYEVSAGNFKSFRQLTISEALDILPYYYSYDSMTMQKLIDAVGIDLSDFKFAEKESFLHQKLSTLPDYMLALPMEDIIEVKESWEDCLTSVDRIVFLLRKATYSDFSEGNLADNIENRLINIGKQNITLGELIDLDEDSNPTIKQIGTVKLVDLIKGDVEENVIYALTKKVDEHGTEQDVTLGELFNLSDTDNISQMLKDVKMSDLIGESAQPDVAIRNAMCQEGNTLGKLLGVTAEDSGIIKLLARIELNDLLGSEANVSNAIKEALCEDEHGNKVTLATVFEITIDSHTSGVVRKMSEIEMEGLLGIGAITTTDTIESFINGLTIQDIFDDETINGNVILEALSTYNNGSEVVATPLSEIPNRIKALTVGDVCTIDESNRILYKIKDAKLDEIADEIDNLTLRDALGEIPEKSIFNLIENYNTVKIKNLTKAYNSSDPVDERGLKTVDFTIENLYNAGIIEETAYHNFIDGHPERKSWTIDALIASFS